MRRLVPILSIVALLAAPALRGQAAEKRHAAGGRAYLSSEKLRVPSGGAFRLSHR